MKVTPAFAFVNRMGQPKIHHRTQNVPLVAPVRGINRSGGRGLGTVGEPFLPRRQRILVLRRR
ncbi:MAG: hypothetical protein ACOWYE_03990 [Desulfatiglandales bacterium]